MRSTKQGPRKTLVDDARIVVDTCLCLNVRLAARLLSRALDDALRPHGLNAAQFGLMAQIAAAGDDTIGGLAERAGFEASTLSRNLKGLERDGLVEIAVVESDSRRRSVWLTERGARRLDAAMADWRRTQAGFDGVFRPALALDRDIPYAESLSSLARSASACVAQSAGKSRRR